MEEEKQTFVRKGYDDDIENALKRALGKREGIWLTEINMKRRVFVTYFSLIKVNTGSDEHVFYTLDEAINYISEYLFPYKNPYTEQKERIKKNFTIFVYIIWIIGYLALASVIISLFNC